MLLREFDQEMASTRKLLECVPDERLTWQPHDKSMSLARLAGHVAELPNWAVRVLETESFEITPGRNPFIPGSSGEVMAAFEKNVSGARAAIGGATDEDMAMDWSLVMGGRKVMTLPRFLAIRSMMMNHLIHHRAQLGVFLRLNHVPIPGMYGPSADDKARTVTG
jgi:uncharacterized damage-inducible protein DinB